MITVHYLQVSYDDDSPERFSRARCEKVRPGKYYHLTYFYAAKH